MAFTILLALKYFKLNTVKVTMLLKMYTTLCCFRCKLTKMKHWFLCLNIILN